MGEGEESIGRHVESDRDIVLKRTCLNSFIAGNGEIPCIWLRPSYTKSTDGFHVHPEPASYPAHYEFNTVGDEVNDRYDIAALLKYEQGREL